MSWQTQARPDCLLPIVSSKCLPAMLLPVNSKFLPTKLLPVTLRDHCLKWPAVGAQIAVSSANQVMSDAQTMHRSAFVLYCSIQQARSCLWSSSYLLFVSMSLLPQVQDSATRLLATLSASYRPVRMHLAQGHGLSLLLQLLRVQACSNAALGNISLCVGDLAREPQLLPVLQQEDAVAPLLGEHLHAPGALASPPSDGTA